MAEKANLVEKLPPVAKADSPPAQPTTPAKPAPTQPTPTPKPAAKPAAKTADTSTAAPTAEKKQDDVVATAQVESAPPSGLTITGMQKATYYSFVGDAVIWGLVGLVLFGKAFKDKAKINFVSMATYGGLLIAFGFLFFINSKTYYSYLVGENPEMALGLRGFGWMVFAPVLFFAISRLVKAPSSDKKFYVSMYVFAIGLFLFIGASQLMDGRLEQIGLSVFPILFAVSLAFLMYMSLGSSSAAFKGALKQKAPVVVYAIIGGWIAYSVINLLSHLAPNVTLYSLMLNGLDFAILGGLTYGLWGGMASGTEKIQLRPIFAKAARRKSGAPFPKPVSDRGASVSTSSEETDSNGKPKPNFKKPKAPANVGNN